MITWASLCVIVLFAGQVSDFKREPTPAVRPEATDPPKTVPETPNVPNSPTLPPADTARDPLPGDVSRDRQVEAPNPLAQPDAGNLPANPDTGNRPVSEDIPSAADAFPPAVLSSEPPATIEPTTPPTNRPNSQSKTPDIAKNPASEMIAETLQLPPGGTIAGQPWPLAQALAASPDRKQQLLIIHSYWQLTEAMAKYRFAAEEAKQFEQLGAAPADEAALLAARSASSATLRESELAVLSAQNDLAALVQLPAGSPLPLPGDKPHVGGYRTNYQEMFAMRSPPPIARIVDRTLPIRQMAIKDRAAAVQAAHDALLAACESYQAGQIDFSTVKSSSEQLLRQQRAMIETVCRYNHDIAEYATAVLGPNITAQQLVNALIETDRGATEPRFQERPGDVQPVQYLQPTNPTGQRAPLQFSPGQPTPALRPTKQEPTPAPTETRPTQQNNTNTSQPTSFQRSANKNITENPSFSPEPTATARIAGAENTAKSPLAAHNAVADQPLVGARSGLNDLSPEDSTALYSALVDAAPAVRAKQLTLALHWDRSLPENSAKPMNLSECLAREAGGNRRETLAVFWTARQRAAEYQGMAQELEFLENLSSETLERRHEPSGATDMLYLRAARLSAKAALQEAQAALTESQFELALRTQSTAEEVWPLSATPPHSGSYEMNLSSQPGQLLTSRPMLRLTAAIPAQAVSVQQHAAAVVDADAARAAAVEAYLSGRKPLSSVLTATAEQAHQTSAFLQTLTDYNRSIAEFALAVLPPDIHADKLAAALVVQP